MAQNIRDEITRLHRRKQLNFTYHNVERMQDSESSGSEMGPDSPRRPDTPPHLRNPEKGLFTFKQVSLVPSTVTIHIFIVERFNNFFRNNFTKQIFPPRCNWYAKACLKNERIRYANNMMPF